MTITIRNQRPAELYDEPFKVLPKISVTKDQDEFLDDIHDIVKAKYVTPMFQPIYPNQPVIIEDTVNGNTQTIDEDTLLGALMHLWTTDTLDVELQDQVGEIFRQGIQYLTPNDWFFEEQLGVEALVRSRLPVPYSKAGRMVQYTASVDIIPTAKNLLAQTDETNATKWFANLAGYTHEMQNNNYLLITVQTGAVFDDLKVQLEALVQAWHANGSITADTLSMFQDFDKIDLTSELSAGLFMPNNGGTSNEEQQAFSFTRVLLKMIAEFEQGANPGALTVQPTNIYQMYMPENIMILNLENYAHATPSEIRDDWNEFQKALNTKKVLNIVSNKRLLTSSAITRNMTTLSGQVSAANNPNGITRSKVKPFSGKPVTSDDMLKLMAQVIKSQVTQQVTHNTYKQVKSSYMRANRRKPDDINLPGKLTTTKYRPDIHIYIDTSGSISESQYRDAVINLISLSKRVECNLYITSFSHFVSQTALLITKDRNPRDIYRQFLRIPKVSGGTDYSNVWQKIEILNDNAQKTGQSHQINFIVTDFEYGLSRGTRWHKENPNVKHSYYVPISIQSQGWDNMVSYAKSFSKQMARAGDYGIRNRILM